MSFCEVLKGVGVGGVGRNDPFFLGFRHFSSLSSIFPLSKSRQLQCAPKNGESYSDPVYTDPVSNFPIFAHLEGLADPLHTGTTSCTSRTTMQRRARMGQKAIPASTRQA